MISEARTMNVRCISWSRGTEGQRKDTTVISVELLIIHGKGLSYL